MDAAAAGDQRRPAPTRWFGIDGTWFWIDPVTISSFVGMIQHQCPAAAEIRGISRSLVYQALMN